jgi:N6-adenosine-specific RNA methylase IME4
MGASRRTMKIADIKVGSRHRKNFGDIAALAKNIEEIGLLHPVVIRPDGRLIAGERRIKALKHLGRKDIAVTIVDLDKVVRGEYAENFFRKAFVPSEWVDIEDALLADERAKAKQRQREAGERGSEGGRGKRKTLGGNSPKGKRAPRAVDTVARVIGKDRRTVEKARAVRDAARAEPEKFGKFLTEMNRTEKVNGPYRRFINTQQAERIRAEPPPLPGNGPYRAGKVDIPWAYEPDDDNAPQRGVLPYSTMSIEQACALDVASMLHDDCIVGMWVTNFVLSRGLHLAVLHAWGKLEPKTIITWPKDRVGRGHWTLGQTEHLVIATRGKAIVTRGDHTTLLKGPFHLVQKNVHSAKPVEAYDYFESLCPAPRYFDLFSRYKHNDKWDCHGDEAPVAASAQSDKVDAG